MKTELWVWLDLRGACKLNKNKRLPWGQSVLLINQLHSAFTVLQWVCSPFGTRQRNWELPNTTLHLQAAEQPSEGRLGDGNWSVWGAKGWKRAGTGCWQRRDAAPFPQAPSGYLWPPSPGQQRGWVPARKTAFVLPEIFHYCFGGKKTPTQT